MAFCNRTLAIKAALGAGFLLILLNLLNSKLDSSSDTNRYSRLKLGVTQWPKRTHGSIEAHFSTSTAGNDKNENTNEQYNTDGHPVNYDSADASRRDASVSNTPNYPAESPGASQPNQSSSVVNGTSVQHNNLEIQNVIKNLEKQPTNRTATTVSAQYELNSDKINNNFSSIATPSISSGSVSSHFSSSISIVGNVSGQSNVKSEKEIKVKTNKSSAEDATNFAHNASMVTALKQEPLKNEPTQRDGSSTNDNNLSDRFTIDSCPPIPPNLDGPITVDVAFESLSAVESRFADKLQPGGQYVPPDCTARNRVAIIVPYRDREKHLPIFLKNIHALLMKQQLEYGIYIVEQTAGSSFNRAALMNIGFVEAMKQKNWECMVFHDIDLLPMDDRNLYTCPDQPRHMSVAVDTFGFKLPYSTIFGGVSAMTEKQFRMVNGFSNAFWGWGGEDDDMSNRLKHVGFHIARYPVNIARYTMLSHKKEKANPKRYEKLVNGAKRFDSDGLNSLHYQLVNLIRKPLYTWIHADISPDGS
ncbi:beta-1,4-N-acetylgalactosaminyltransferase bre-4 [Anopheles arabiensis]|uniref:beta-1,4-N-acetylgalactosaminyltransferase bre-4 n=1 Tax=Anopheles arabiensis TaxID=7173 RepID=UPI001AADC098|nr:beta-1,4-N-acetylgalactosaminyltransferase bre-4 [Anopheles arabiensis]XP_040154276.1 beta-1,4-N-acetylgalactosaminyltransferase bre-4 [Anopheles arabiensis]XP_040154277.1 beta-1,4-N-acetylgalactosaminyltransferase bre-4 [Anopheles arabiensis]